MSVFALVPARGGSKGIPRKNIRMMAGKPLIVWTIEAALATPGLATVVVSTEDEEIAAVARAAGAAVPFLRPAALAADDTPGIDTVLHAIKMLPQYDAVLLLQPTSPLRGAREIAGTLALAANTEAPAIVSVCEPADHPAWMYRLDNDSRMQPLLDSISVDRRQELPPVYALNGAIYYARTRWLAERRSFVATETLGYLMSPEDSVDIDGPLDWQLAELLLTART